MIDKNKIFDLFGSDIEGEDDLINAKEEILDEPYNYIGMFIKLIINHIIFHQKLSKFLVKENSNIIDLESTKEASSFAIFNRAWFYLKKIDLKNKNHFNAIVKFKQEPFVSTLQESLSYFEDKEEYEICAKLLKIIKLKKTS